MLLYFRYSIHGIHQMSTVFCGRKRLKVQLYTWLKSLVPYHCSIGFIPPQHCCHTSATLVQTFTAMVPYLCSIGAIPPEHLCHTSTAMVHYLRSIGVIPPQHWCHTSTAMVPYLRRIGAIPTQQWWWHHSTGVVTSNLIICIQTYINLTRNMNKKQINTPFK